jgi:AraC-like DNA-binding protein
MEAKPQMPLENGPVLKTPDRDLGPRLGSLWLAGAGSPPGSMRERVLPTGQAHLVVRLSGPPLRLYRSVDDECGELIGHCIVGGPREHAYLRELDASSSSVGVELRAGAAERLLGVPAHLLAGRHVPLDALWGDSAIRIRERLLAATTAERLDVFEQELRARLRPGPALCPAVAHGLRSLRSGMPVRDVVRASGLSHGRFIELFRAAVGLSPKAWSRVQRFRRALTRLAREPEDPLVELALAADYYDQPHFTHEFRAIAGLTPEAYRRIGPAQPHHVPIRGAQPEGPARVR